MRLKLDKRHRIVTDSRNYIIQKGYKVKDEESKNYGKIEWRNIPGCYCSTLESAIRRYKEFRRMTSKIKSWEELNKLEREFQEIMRHINETLGEGLKKCK